MTNKSYRHGIAILLLAAAGCGSVPEVLTQVVRDSAKDAVVEQVDELVNEMFEEIMAEIEIPSLLEGDAQDEE